MKTTACFRESNVSLNVVTRLLYIALALFPLLCYLEWGGTRSAFLFEAEYQVLFHPKEPGKTFTHPLILLPLAGQLILLIAACLKKPDRRMALAGQLMLSILVGLILIVGLLDLNSRIILSTAPFIIASVVFYRNYKKFHPQNK